LINAEKVLRGEWHVKLSARDGNFHVTCVCVKEKRAKSCFAIFERTVIFCMCSAKILLDWQAGGLLLCCVRVDKRMDKLFPLFQPIQIYTYVVVVEL
jgi:hypothetical protein